MVVMALDTYALAWYGGKAGGGRNTGAWIRSLLPQGGDVTYVEPYAGMLGVLLARHPARREVVNDLNDRVVNWWQVVRDEPEEFEYKLAHTPRSERLFAEAKETIDEGDRVERALKFQLVVMLGIAHGDGVAGGYGVIYSERRTRSPRWFSSRIPALARRVADVEMTQGAATEVLARFADDEDAVIYCDPPYRTARTDAYAVDQQDYDGTLAMLKAQRGRVAISGYGDEWSDLGWQRHEHDVVVSVVVPTTQSIVPRTEVLWTNYRTGQEQLL